MRLTSSSGSALRWSVGALAALLLLLGAWWWRALESQQLAHAVQPRTADHPGAFVAAEAGVAAEGPLAGPTSGPRNALSSAATSQPRRRPALEFDGAIRGVVLDQRGQPVAGAELVLTQVPGGGQLLLSSGLASGPAAEASARSALDGRFEFEAYRGACYDLVARAAPQAQAWAFGVQAGSELELRLEASVGFWGHLTREGDGRAVPGARLRVYPSLARGYSTAVLLSEADSAADGSYRIEGLPHLGLYLEVAPQSGEVCEWVELLTPVSGLQRQDIELALGRTLCGRVLDAATHQPIAAAEVAGNYAFRDSVSTDDRGRYTLAGVESSLQSEIHARAPGYGRVERRPPEAASGFDLEDFDFELQPARRARGRVICLDGTPALEVQVSAQASSFDANGLQTIDVENTRSDALGCFEFHSLRPDVPHALVLSKAGWATAVFEFPAAESAETLLELGEYVLRPPGRVAGRIVDERSQPWAGAQLRLVGWNVDRWRDNPVRQEQLDAYVGTRAVDSGPRGEFEFGALPAGDYALEVARDERRFELLQTLSLAEGEQRTGLELCLVRGLSIRGRVVDDQGRPRPHVMLSVDPAPGSTGSNADVESQTDGSFVADGLLPGEYELRAYPYPLPGEADQDLPWFQGEVRRAQAGMLGVEIVLRKSVSLVVEIVDELGQARANVRAVVSEPGCGLRQVVHGDEHGALRFFWPRGAEFEFELWDVARVQLERRGELELSGDAQLDEELEWGSPQARWSGWHSESSTLRLVFAR